MVVIFIVSRLDFGRFPLIVSYPESLLAHTLEVLKYICHAVSDCARQQSITVVYNYQIFLRHIPSVCVIWFRHCPLSLFLEGGNTVLDM